MAKGKGLDAEALALLDANPAGRPGSNCFFAKHPDQVALVEALRRNGGEFSQISRILAGRKLNVKGQTISRHLGGECRCGK